ncbi:MAG: hypothetical protein M4579_000144 [Chaenotheca gracillima]|nr:MAG: hypothetical protein M4579_000144 [Chaenotheca gracillima]
MAAQASYRSTSLLLLSPSSNSVNSADLNASYGPSLAAALSAVAEGSRSQPRGSVLEVGLICIQSKQHRPRPRANDFDRVQRLVAGIYRLICQICSKESIPTQGPDGVDARVLLLAGEDQELYEDGSDASISEGPVASLHALALSRRHWTTVYVPDGAQGDSVLRDFVSLTVRDSSSAQPPWKVRRVKAGKSPGSRAEDGELAQDLIEKTRTHHSVAVGGTFDHLHIGHKLLLTMTAFLVQPSTRLDPKDRHLIVGITKDELLKNKKYAEFLSSWQDRQEDVADFLNTIVDFRPANDGQSEAKAAFKTTPSAAGLHAHLFPDLWIDYVELSDPFGPTVTDESISALIISGETRSGGQAVNTKRNEAGWASLDVFEVDVLDAAGQMLGDDSFLDKISSTAIRRLKAEGHDA